MVGTRRLLVGELERECSCAAVGDVTIAASLSLASHDRKVGSVSRVCEASWIGGGWRQTPPVPRRCLCIGPHAGVARPYTSEASRNICIRFGHLNIPGHSPPSTPIVLIPRLYPPPSGSHPHGRVQWAFLPPSAPPLPREFTPPVCCCISRRAVEISWRIHLWMKPRCLESAWVVEHPPLLPFPHPCHRHLGVPSRDILTHHPGHSCHSRCSGQARITPCWLSSRMARPTMGSWSIATYG